jgi:hypothetical protein
VSSVAFVREVSSGRRACGWLLLKLSAAFGSPIDHQGIPHAAAVSIGALRSSRGANAPDILRSLITPETTQQSRDPLLTPALLCELAAMGHGDFIAICDANFPAYSIAGDRPLIHLPGCGTIEVLRAILSVLPLDTFDGSPVQRMQQVGDVDTLAEIQKEAFDTVFFEARPGT